MFVGGGRVQALRGRLNCVDDGDIADLVFAYPDEKKNHFYSFLFFLNFER